MKFRFYNILYFALSSLILLESACQSKPEEQSAALFTEADSLTEILLNLQDSIVVTWNQMMNDDNAKIKAMHYLLHEIEIGGQIGPGEARAMQQRINQLKAARYHVTEITNSERVEEYDFASNSLVTELISRAEASPSYAYNSTMQKLVEQIRTAEQRVDNFRKQYDALAGNYNTVLSDLHHVHADSDNNISLKKKPLFQVNQE
jgi:hypothetical protein